MPGPLALPEEGANGSRRLYPPPTPVCLTRPYPKERRIPQQPVRALQAQRPTVPLFRCPEAISKYRAEELQESASRARYVSEEGEEGQGMRTRPPLPGSCVPWVPLSCY